MGRLSWPRVLLGGVVAGLIIIVGEYILNGVILASQWAALRAQLGLGELSAAQLTAGAVITLLYGIVLIWTYAAIRPRFGPGPRTALIAAAFFWIIAYALFTASVAASGFLTVELTLITCAWGVVEAPVAALAGAWLYSEPGDAS